MSNKAEGQSTLFNLFVNKTKEIGKILFIVISLLSTSVIYAEKSPTFRIEGSNPANRLHKNMQIFPFRYYISGDHSALSQYGIMRFIYNGKATQRKGVAVVSWYKMRSLKADQPLTVDLRKKRFLYLAMRGRRGSEIVRVAVGKGRSKNNSGTRYYRDIALTKKLRIYHFDLQGVDLSAIKDLVSLIFYKRSNPSGATVFVKWIEYTSTRRNRAISVPYKKEQPAISSQEKYAAAMLERWKNGKIKRGYLQKSVSQGYLCAKNSWVSFYKNGRLKYFFPAKKVIIQGIACQPLSRVSLYPNGKLKECILAKALQRNGEKYPAGSAIALNSQGRLRKFFHEIEVGMTPEQYMAKDGPNKKIDLSRYYLIKNFFAYGMSDHPESELITDLNRFLYSKRKRKGYITTASNKKVVKIYWLANPTGAFHSFNLQRYTKLRIRLRGKRGGERVSFLFGGLQFFDPNAQSFCQDSSKVSKGPIVLGRSWQTITIDLSKHDRRSIDNLFTIFIHPSKSAQKRTIYIKEIYYE